MYREQKQPKEQSPFSKWLNDNYQSPRTKKNYIVAILTFLKTVYPEEFAGETEKSTKIDGGINRYLQENRDILEDAKRMLSYMRDKNYAPKTSRMRIATVKVFFEEHGKPIDRKDWRSLARRKVIPRPIALTADMIPTKEQIKSILAHLPLNIKAIALFLLSSSARVSETLQLRVDDLEMDSDPPKARFRASTTKGGIPRTVRMSYEARDMIKEWLKIKDTLKKPGGSLNRGKDQTYNKELVFDITATGFRLSWKRALRKTGLAKKDSETRIHIYHPHTLRKYGATEWSKRGIPRDVYEGAFMGHEEYLDASYKRYRPEEIDQLYIKNMDAITVYGGAVPSNFLEKLEAIEKETKEKDEALRQKDEELKKVDEVLDKLGIENHRPREERLLEYFRMTQEAKIQKQVIKSESVPPTKPVQNTPTIKPKEIPEQPTQPKSLEPEGMNETPCLKHQTWVNKCECIECQKTDFPTFSECFSIKNKIRVGKASKEEIAKFQNISQ